jgi:ABC-2 type transport system permease protein
MRETFVIAKREFIERVRTKWFVAMTVLGPILMIGLIVIPALLAGRGSEGAKVEIADDSGTLGAQLATAFQADGDHWKATVVPATTSDTELLARIKHHDINGFIRIAANALDTGEIVYRGDNATNQEVQILLQKVVRSELLMVRAKRAHVDDTQLKAMLGPIELRTLHTNGESQGESGMATFFLGYFIALILYMVITLYGVNVMRSVVSEKSSRVMELMVAATKPRALMAGKIAGVGGAALAQISIWFVIGGIALAYRDSILTALGASAAGSALPALSFGEIGVIVAFFVLGFLFYSTLYAAVGAMVSSEQESQQAQMPVTMFLVIGMVSMTAITGDPRGASAVALTLVPFWSPMLMPLRFVLGGASPGEVALSLAILGVSILVVSRAAAKIYRVGILMYGKRPTARELIRWLRY